MPQMFYDRSPKVRGRTSLGLSLLPEILLHDLNMKCAPPAHVWSPAVNASSEHGEVFKRWVLAEGRRSPRSGLEDYDWSLVPSALSASCLPWSDQILTYVPAALMFSQSMWEYAQTEALKSWAKADPLSSYIGCIIYFITVMINLTEKCLLLSSSNNSEDKGKHPWGIKLYNVLRRVKS